MKLVELGCPACGGDLVMYYDDDNEYSCLLCSRDYSKSAVREVLERKRAVYRALAPTKEVSAVA